MFTQPIIETLGKLPHHELFTPIDLEGYTRSKSYQAALRLAKRLTAMGVLEKKSPRASFYGVTKAAREAYALVNTCPQELRCLLYVPIHTHETLKILLNQLADKGDVTLRNVENAYSKVAETKGFRTPSRVGGNYFFYVDRATSVHVGDVLHRAGLIQKPFYQGVSASMLNNEVVSAKDKMACRRMAIMLQDWCQLCKGRFRSETRLMIAGSGTINAYNPDLLRLKELFESDCYFTKEEIKEFMKSYIGNSRPGLAKVMHQFGIVREVMEDGDVFYYPMAAQQSAYELTRTLDSAGLQDLGCARYASRRFFELVTTRWRAGKELKFQLKDLSDAAGITFGVSWNQFLAFEPPEAPVRRDWRFWWSLRKSGVIDYAMENGQMHITILDAERLVHIEKFVVRIDEIERDLANA